MNQSIKKIMVVCIFFYTHGCVAGLQSLLPELNTSLNTLSISLPNAQEGSFIEGSFNFSPFVELLKDRDFQKATGLTYFEAQDLYAYHIYYCYIKMGKIIGKDDRQWEIIERNWNSLKKFFPVSVQLSSFEVTDEGLIGHVQLFKDKKSTQPFSLDDCTVIVDELKKLGVTVTCLAHMPIKILASKNKEVMLTNKNKIVELLEESLRLKNSFGLSYQIIKFVVQNDIPKRVGGAGLRD